MTMPSYLDNLTPEDKDILSKVISLITKYPLLEKALIHCGEIGRVKPTVALNNIRDFLSHLHTLFSNWEELTKDDKLNQLAPAEEHLRRAIIESYQLAAEQEEKTLMETYESYNSTVLPLARKMNPVPLTNDETREKMATINDWMIQGRTAKSENRWTATWEKGIEHFTNATKIARKLNDELKGEVVRADQIRRERKVFWLTTVIAVVTAIVFFILGKLF